MSGGGNGDRSGGSVPPSAIAPAWMLELDEIIKAGVKAPDVARIAFVVHPLSVGTAPGHAEVLVGLHNDLNPEWTFSRWPLVTLLSLLTQAMNAAGVVRAVEMTKRPQRPHLER